MKIEEIVTPNDESTSSSNLSASSSCQQTDGEENKYEKQDKATKSASNRPTSQYIKVPRHKQPIQKMMSHSSGGGTETTAAMTRMAGSIRSSNYYTTSRYRRLDEIFDRQMTIGPRSKLN